LLTRIIRARLDDQADLEDVAGPLVDAFRALLADTGADPAFVAETVTLPGEGELAQAFEHVDVDRLHAARKALKLHLATRLELAWVAAGERTTINASSRYATVAAVRRLMHAVALTYLGALKKPAHLQQASEAFEQADNMTVLLGVLA